MKKAFGGIYMALVFLFLYVPIAVMLFFSFNSNTKLITVFEGFTLSNYTSLFDNSELMEALFNTLIIAALSCGISAVIGTLLMSNPLGNEPPDADSSSQIGWDHESRTVPYGARET